MQAIGNSRHSPDLVLLRTHLRRPQRMAAAHKNCHSPDLADHFFAGLATLLALLQLWHFLAPINFIPHIALILLGILLSSTVLGKSTFLSLLNTPRWAAIAFALVVIPGSPTTPPAPTPNTTPASTTSRRSNGPNPSASSPGLRQPPHALRFLQHPHPPRRLPRSGLLARPRQPPSKTASSSPPSPP